MPESTSKDWTEFRRKQKAARKQSAPVRDWQARQVAIRDFATAKGLGCFKCGTSGADWAKSGWNSRGPWVICSSCVRSKTSG